MRTLFLFLLLAGNSFSADEGFSAPKPPLIREVRRSSEDALEKTEDGIVSILSSMRDGLHSVALQNTLLSAVEGVLRKTLPIDFIQKASISEDDRVFFRELFQQLHLAYRAPYIVVKKEAQFIEARELTASISVHTNHRTQAERLRNEAPSSEYVCVLLLRKAREWTNGTWSLLKAEIPIGTFRLTVEAPANNRERIINDGKWSVTVKSSFGLAPLESSGLPSHDGFSVFQDIAHVKGQDLRSQLQKLADAKDTEAQYVLGLSYELGILGEADNAAAIRLYRNSVASGSPFGTHRLGLMYLKGSTQSKALALQLFERSAEAGSTEAMGRFGSLLISGEAGMKDTERGIRALDKAASLGDAQALVELSKVVSNESFRAEAAVVYRALTREVPTARELLLTAAKRQDVSAAALLAEGGMDSLKWFILAKKWKSENIYPERTSVSTIVAARNAASLVKNLSEDEIEAVLAEAIHQDIHTQALAPVNPFSAIPR